MAEYKSKRIAVSGVEDKQKITATFAASLSGLFLPFQLVYQGKTCKCHPSVTHSANHWCTEETLKSY